MSTAEFHDDDLSDEDGVDDDVDLDELSDLDSVALGSGDTDADDTDDTSDVAVDDADDDADDDEADDDADDKAEDTEAEDEVEEADEIDEGEESLDVLLAREKVLDEDDLGRIAEESRTGLNPRPALIGADEFTCRSCFLVKRRAQLADEQRLLCFDCV